MSSIGYGDESKKIKQRIISEFADTPDKVARLEKLFEALYAELEDEQYWISLED